MKIKVDNYASFDEFSASGTAGNWNTITVIREDGWIKSDLMTECKSYKTALRRFFDNLKDVPEVAEWRDCITESCECGYFKGNEPQSYAWAVEEINEGEWYIFLNTRTEQTDNEPSGTTDKGVTTMTATMQINTEFNGIEITFADRPNAQTRAELKAHGFRWHSVKKLWYAKQSPDRLAFAQTLTGSTEEPLEAEPKQDPVKLTNKFGVGVGDIFYASWGYEQTNADFFQVVELVGKASVRVREVYLQRIAEDPVSPMSADRTYKITRELLPPAPHSVFIKDNEKGDLKRLKSYAEDGISNPQFYLSSFCDAHLVTSDKLTAYESWYY